MENPRLLKAGVCKNYLFFRCFDNVAAHIRPQDFRHDNAAVCLLVILENSGNSTSYRHTWTIQGMYEFRFGFSVAAETDVSAASLEIKEIGCLLYTSDAADEL